MQRRDLGQDRAAGPSAEKAAGEANIAERLDAIEAERVFRRALELEAEHSDQPHLFDSDQLERIAAEINMDAGFVRQALGEVRLQPEPRTWLDTKILPEPIMEAETVSGLSRAEIATSVAEWMRNHEGLIEQQHLVDGALWDVDRRLSARLRTSGASGGNRVSRVTGGDIAHRIHSLSDTEHVVALQTAAERPLALAKVGLGAGVLIVAGAVAAGIGLSVVDYLQLLASALLTGAVVAGGAIAGARRWARSMGRALRRSITGLTQRAQVGPEPQATHMLRPIADEVIRIVTDRIKRR